MYPEEGEEKGVEMGGKGGEMRGETRGKEGKKGRRKSWEVVKGERRKREGEKKRAARVYIKKPQNVSVQGRLCTSKFPHVHFVQQRH